MVLQNVPDNAVLVKVSAASFRAKGFLERENDALHVLVAPDPFEPRVGESQDGEVLDHFLAKVMVNAVEMVFGKVLRQGFVEFFKGFEVPSKGLFDNHAGPSLGGVLHARLFNGNARFGKDIGRNGKIKEPIKRFIRLIFLGFCLVLFNILLEIGKGLEITVALSTLVTTNLQKGCDLVGCGFFFEIGAQPLTQLIVSEFGTGVPKHDRILWQQTVRV